MIMRRNPHPPEIVWIFAACSICFIGATAATIHLGYESLWYDEFITFDYSSGGPIALTRITAQDVHPPLYLLFVWLWNMVTGSFAVPIMRLSSVFPMVIAIALSYRLSTRWFENRWVGIGAAAALASSGIIIYYARELRMYTFVLLLVLVSWWYLGEYLRGTHRRAWRYGVVVALMAYTYYFSAFIVLVQGIAVLLFYRHRLRGLLISYSIPTISLLPWLPTFINQLQLESSRAGREFTLANIGKFAATEPTTGDAIATFIQTYTAGQLGFVLLLLVIGLIGGLQPKYSPHFRRKVVVVSLWLLLTPLLFFTVNLVIPVYNLRYLLMIIPALAMIIGIAIALMPPEVRSASLVIALLVGLGAHQTAFLPPKVPHRELLLTIAQGYQEGDRIWYNLDSGARGSTLQYEPGEYYLRYITPQLRPEFFVWAAPAEFQTTEAAARVWDVRPY